MNRIAIHPERPDHPGIRALLGQLDAYLASLYAPEDNHILDERALLAPGVTFLAARDGGDFVGCGAFRHQPSEPETGHVDYVEIKRMFVLPHARGRGIAVRLLAELEREARAQGRVQALLETGHDQYAALRLYERCGYRRRGPFAGYPDNGLSVFMGKHLT
jgi:putative acetyltransferase